MGHNGFMSTTLSPILGQLVHSSLRRAYLFMENKLERKIHEVHRRVKNTHW